MKIGAVLMASGAAHRFGSNKLLHEVDGVPMIQRTMQAVPARLFDRAGVASSYPEILSLAEQSGYLPIPNPSAAEGQSASIRLGLSALKDMDGVLFAVCDQPWLKQESVIRLRMDFSEHPGCICALGWQGRRGNPVIFPKAFFPDLLSLSGDQRGAALIRSHKELLRMVEVASASELRDVDAPENLC